MATQFEPDDRQRGIIARALEEADRAFQAKRYAPDELVRRMTIESKNAVRLADSPDDQSD
ncbi:MAG: hypothetical protein EON54_12115 [Alcaligenaceae bacterium]|nr:MAG: hypothetical protein EON54_12115 [Alcaligenaceae bacterium]